MEMGKDFIIMSVLVSIGAVISLIFAIVATTALVKYSSREVEWRIKKVDDVLLVGLIVTFIVCLLVVFGPSRLELLISWPFIVAYVIGAVASGLRVYIDLISGDQEANDIG